MPEVGRGTRGEGDRDREWEVTRGESDWDREWEVSLTTVISQRLTLFKATEMELSIDAVGYM